MLAMKPLLVDDDSRLVQSRGMEAPKRFELAGSYEFRKLQFKRLPSCDLYAGTNRKAQSQREERMRLNRRFVNMGLAASLAAPAFSRVARADGEVIKISMVLPVTGPAADNGKYSLTGAKTALNRVNKAGGVLGRQVELVTEDDQTTNPGAVLAFSKLAGQPDIVAFIGSIGRRIADGETADVLRQPDVAAAYLGVTE
jgi:Periplasmic binding protein